MHRVYEAKNILNIHKHCDGGWFWVKYSASPYVGCEYGCEYCYAREEKYSPHLRSGKTDVPELSDPFSQYIKIKKNAPQLLEKALRNRFKDIIYLDSYQPLEARYKYARKMLEVCLRLGFPVFINEKSPLLLRDLDLLKELKRTSHINVGWSIMTAEDNIVKEAFEPKTPPVSARFAAMRRLSHEGIMTGTVFMPILPFISDSDEDIESVIRRTKESGGQYVLDGGLTLAGYCRTHFFRILQRHNASMVTKYEELYGSEKLQANHMRKLHNTVVECCEKYELMPYIPRPTAIYPKELQLNRKIAGQFYLKARELQLSGGDDFRQWAYRKAAWSLDDLDEDIENVYMKQGIEGLMQIKGIGSSLAKEITTFLKNGD